MVEGGICDGVEVVVGDGRSTPTCFVIMEVYESAAGVANHWRLGAETWKDFPALGAWAGTCKVTAVHGAPVIHSLW